MTIAATAGGGSVRTGGMTAEERKVIFASSLGTVFEWYDFYIYGTLGVFLAKYFFSNVPPAVGFIFALLAFAAGFAVRPFGALIFGRLGDMIGRKYTFLITMTLMGIGTFFIGLLPGYATWGIAAPIVLIGLRLIQGLALGGEYGGAATYVAEHAPKDRRGYYTSWIQTTATLGLFLAAAGVWTLGRRSAIAPLPSYHQLTFERGLVYAARFAQDGRSIYYSASWSGQPVQLYSTLPDSPESRSLNLTNSTLFAVSSSELAISVGCNDRYIGICQGTLGLLPVSGGSPREVEEDVLAADWNADGSEMAVIRQANGKNRVEFPRGKMIYESYHPLAYLRIAPDGKSVAFVELATADGDGGSVIAMDRNGKELVHSETYVSVEGLAWPPSGKEVWAAATTTEGWADAIHALGFNHKERIVLRLPGILRLHDISPDGRKFLYRTAPRYWRLSWRSRSRLAVLAQFATSFTTAATTRKRRNC